MQQEVVLSVEGKQCYPGQDPDTIELVTTGTLEYTDLGWKLCYEESELTGLAGVHTTFLVRDGEVTLIRTGRLSSEMIFREGESHDSLYKMEFGALMLTVCANRVQVNLTQQGGVIYLCYTIEVEQSAAGTIEYHLDIRAK